MVVAQLGAKINAFFEIGFAGRQLVADGEVASPCAAAQLHANRHFGIEWLREKFPTQCLEAVLKVVADAVTDDIEEPAVAAGARDFISYSARRCAGDQRLDVYDRQARTFSSHAFHEALYRLISRLTVRRKSQLYGSLPVLKAHCRCARQTIKRSAISQEIHSSGVVYFGDRESGFQ